MSTLDEKLNEIITLEKEKTLIDDRISQTREFLVKELSKENIKSYKNDLGSVTKSERKSVAFDNKEKIIKKLKSQKKTEYIEVIPQKEELSKLFLEQIKNGNLSFDGVEVLTTEYVTIKLNK